ncbi:DUF4014 family protein [Salmonella enterica]|nr:DUF4014 domain-containing protein [Salmonella enterica]EEF7432055.1 DUF4014 domain-containing protein [Salmonella enterica subsp. enterica serovar Java]EKN5803201.1 DUF4014 family protein [Salmonella enterica subsp. enterica]EEH8828362.1 DUF4014 domain-containing protein [Salmonella enterica]EEP1486619.1 DUF4014 domain-containing protein [Salmonella enterica]
MIKIFRRHGWYTKIWTPVARIHNKLNPYRED